MTSVLTLVDTGSSNPLKVLRKEYTTHLSFEKQKIEKSFRLCLVSIIRVF